MIFCITEKGLFTAWELPTLKRAASIYFGMTTVTMIVLKRFDKRIIIAFEHQILVLNIDPFEKVKDFNLECQKLITDVKVSKHEEKMAVAFAADQEGSAYIEIFKIDHTANKFISSSKIENIASKIEFMDFSEDNYYLMYKDNVTQKCFYDLTNSKKNDTLAIDFDMEWVSEGIKLSEKTSELEKYCEEDNTFRCMVRAGKESLIVTDEIGTIRIFEYPSQKGRGYYKLYTQHLSFITTCHISKNQEYLVTASRLDRCIFIWKVNKLNKDGRLENKQ
jgi:WD40 repeat protein